MRSVAAVAAIETGAALNVPPWRTPCYEGVIQDTLTGAYNRRHFEQFLSSEVTQASRFGVPLALVRMFAEMLRIRTHHVAQRFPCGSNLWH